MNVLEKILEEIDKTEENYSHRGHSPTFLKGACNMYADVKAIIRSHMDEVPDTSIGDWIPVSERLPETSKMVLVTVHTSEWISDYHSKWVPEEEKIHYEEKYRTSYGYIDDRGIWICLDETNNEIYCEKEFGTDKGKAYDVVVAWKPLPESYREKN